MLIVGITFQITVTFRKNSYFYELTKKENKLNSTRSLFPWKFLQSVILNYSYCIHIASWSINVCDSCVKDCEYKSNNMYET